MDREVVAPTHLIVSVFGLETLSAKGGNLRKTPRSAINV